VTSSKGDRRLVRPSAPPQRPTARGTTTLPAIRPHHVPRGTAGPRPRSTPRLRIGVRHLCAQRTCRFLLRSWRPKRATRIVFSGRWWRPDELKAGPRSEVVPSRRGPRTPRIELSSEVTSYVSSLKTPMPGSTAVASEPRLFLRHDSKRSPQGQHPIFLLQRSEGFAEIAPQFLWSGSYSIRR